MLAGRGVATAGLDSAPGVGILRLMVMSKLWAENKSSECDGFPSSDGVLFPPAKGLAAIKVSTPGSSVSIAELDEAAPLVLSGCGAEFDGPAW